ncbi:hypothetical protein LT493_42885 [Streptomyces tricolor]|nr:hypothetical protein [Streptomyces tricolor]
MPGHPTVLRVSVTNRGTRACVVDRVPTVTFGNLDGAALPVPEGGTGTYRLAARHGLRRRPTIVNPRGPRGPPGGRGHGGGVGRALGPLLHRRPARHRPAGPGLGAGDDVVAAVGGGRRPRHRAQLRTSSGA